jgi:autotransporter-associated beta strand protein
MVCDPSAIGRVWNLHTNGEAMRTRLNLLSTMQRITQHSQPSTEPPQTKGFPAMQTTRHFALVALGLLAVLAAPAHAQPYTWTAGGSDNRLDNLANWTDGSGQPATTSFLLGGTSALVFGDAGSTVNVDQFLGASYSFNSITYTRAITLGNSVGGESGTPIYTGSGGITIDSSLASDVQFNPDWYVNANQPVANNSSQTFFIRRWSYSSTNKTVTNSGIGTGWFRLNGIVGGNLIQDSATSSTSIGWLGGAITGNLTVKKGTVNFEREPSVSSTGTITLGDASMGASDTATLRHQPDEIFGAAGVTSPDSITSATPIMVAGTSGTITILSGKATFGGGRAPVNQTIDWTGGVTGSNSLYLQNIPDPNYGDDNIRFSGSNPINMTNALIHVGTGTGTATIDSVIGPNVTEVIQNSGTSSLILGGVNTYIGDTTVTAGTLQLTSAGELRFRLQNGNVSNGILGSGSVSLDGLFRLDGSALSATSGVWNLVDVDNLTETFGSTFGLRLLGEDESFNDDGDGEYSYSNSAGNWSFSEATGQLVLVPEPGAFALAGIGVAAAGWALRRRWAPRR